MKHQSLRGDDRTDSLKRQSSRKLKLNIGGRLFYTSRDTLTRDTRSIFNTLLDELTVDENGEYFIDREGSNFVYILSFLRGYDITDMLQHLDRRDRQLLKQDVMFYQIYSMLPLFDLVEEETETRQLSPLVSLVADNSEKTRTLALCSPLCVKIVRTDGHIVRSLNNKDRFTASQTTTTDLANHCNWFKFIHFTKGRLILCSTGSIKIWHFTIGKTFKLSGAIERDSVKPQIELVDKDLVLTASEKNCPVIWNAQGKSLFCMDFPAPIVAVVTLTNLAAISSLNELRVYYLSSNRCKLMFQSPTDFLVKHLKFLSPSRVLAANDHSCCVWDTTKYEMIFKGQSKTRIDRICSIDSSRFAYLCGEKLVIRDIRNPSRKRKIIGSFRFIEPIFIQSKLIALNQDCNNICIWDIASSRLLRTFISHHQGYVSAMIQISQNLIATADAQTVIVRNVETGKMNFEVQFKKQLTYDNPTLHKIQDDRFLVCTNDKIIMFHAMTGDRLGIIKDHCSTVIPLDISL